MKINILINGAFGKMGIETVKAVENDSELVLVGKGGRENDLKQLIETTQPDVVIDFTAPDVAFANTLTIIEAGKHPVIGTTGFSEQQIEQLGTLCQQKKIGAIIAPNFAIGVILMMRFASQAIRYFPHAEIIESHHDTKLDAPSGTAIKTAQMMLQNREEHLAKKSLKETLAGSRGADYQGIAIHAVRLPGLLGHQMVMFGGTGELLTIKHDTTDRKCFMAGILLACKKVMDLNELVYGLEHLI